MTPSIGAFWTATEQGRPLDTPDWLAALSQAALAEAAFNIPAARACLHACNPPSAWQAVRELLAIRVELREGHQPALHALKPRLAALLQSTTDEPTLARAWHTTGVVHTRLNEFERAEHALLEALRRIEPSPARLWILDSMGQCFQGQGAWSEARRVLQGVASLKQASGDVMGTAISVGNLALLELGLGRNPQAEAALVDVLQKLGPKLPSLSRLRLETLLLQSRLDTPGAAAQAEALERALAQCGESGHHLKAFACLALARARPDMARQWLELAEHDFTAPADLALVRYWRLRLLPKAADDAAQVAETRSLIRRAGPSSEAELLTHLLFAERSSGTSVMNQHLDEAFEFAQRANNPLWVERVDRLYERLDPRGFSHRVLERFAGRSLEELQKTTLEDATSVFADLVGFTLRSQELSPEEVMETVRSLFELAVPLFVRFRVRPLQHQGDGLLAVCQGADHARRGLAFARAFVARTLRVTRVREALGEKWGLTVRAGVASGPTVLGVLGSHYKMEFQAIGRTVNLASRLQGQAQPGQVTASLDCAKAAGLDLGGLVREQADLKGFSQPESFVRLQVTLQE